MFFKKTGNMTQVPGAVIHLIELTTLPNIPPVLRSYRRILLWVLRYCLILLPKHEQLYCINALFYKGYKSIDNTRAERKHY